MVAKKKKNTKIAPKKTTKKVVKKTKSLSTAKKSVKRKIKEVSQEVIFDSKIGKTDALFVSEPESPLPMSQEIEKVLQEIDNPQQSQPQQPEPQTQPEKENPSLPKGISVEKKSWWQKLLGK